MEKIHINLKSLNDIDILSHTRELVTKEKQITLEILHYLREISLRKLYLARGYSSLFDFCIIELGYSEGSANRRISSMHLLVQLPEVEEKIKENKVNLSTLTQLSSHIRREEKFKNKKIPKEEKLQLLARIENKSQEQCQRELLKHSSQGVLSMDRQRPISEDLTEIRFVASKELMGKIKRLKNLLGHKNPNPQWGEFFEMLADTGPKKLDPGLKETNSKKVGETKDQRRSKEIDSNKVSETKNYGSKNQQSTSDSTAAGANRRVNPNSRYISQEVKAFVWHRDQGRCQYIDSKSKKKCESQFALQIDHVHPYSLGGPTKPDNLRLLCRAHNGFLAKEAFGLVTSHQKNFKFELWEHINYM